MLIVEDPPVDWECDLYMVSMMMLVGWYRPRTGWVGAGAYLQILQRIKQEVMDTAALMQGLIKENTRWNIQFSHCCEMAEVAGPNPSARRCTWVNVEAENVQFDQV